MAPRWRDIGPVLLIVIGLGIAGYGQFAMLRPGVYLYVADEPTEPDGLASDATVVAYENLSPRMQRKFEQRLAGERTYLGGSIPEPGPWDVGKLAYVEYSGEYFETGVSIRHPTAVTPATVVTVGIGMAVLGLVLGIVRLRKNSWR